MWLGAIAGPPLGTTPIHTFSSCWFCCHLSYSWRARFVSILSNRIVATWSYSLPGIDADYCGLVPEQPDKPATFGQLFTAVLHSLPFLLIKLLLLPTCTKASCVQNTLQSIRLGVTWKPPRRGSRSKQPGWLLRKRVYRVQVLYASACCASAKPTSQNSQDSSIEPLLAFVVFIKQSVMHELWCCDAWVHELFAVRSHSQRNRL